MLIPQSSGAGIPADALGNLGDLYFDTVALRWYLKRWVGNFTGNDYAKSSTFKIGTTIDASVTFRTAASIGNEEAYFGKEYTLKIRRSPGGGLDVLIGDGTWRHVMRDIASLLNSKWYNVRVAANASGVTVWLNGGIVKTNVPCLVADAPAQALQIGNVNTSSSPGVLICNARMNASLWQIGEGAGNSLRDASGTESLPLFDDAPATFWAQAWVPMDLL